LVVIDLSDRIQNIWYYKWSLEKYKFALVNLENIKEDLLKTFDELSYYVSDEYFGLHEPSELKFKGSISIRNG